MKARTDGTDVSDTRLISTVLLLGASLALPVQADDGTPIFKASCATCRGETGTSETSTAKTLEIPPPKGTARSRACRSPT